MGDFNKLLVFTGWYPTHEQPLQYPFVAQQVKIMKKYLPELSGKPWKIVVWNEQLPIDMPNRFIRGITPKNEIWNDEGVTVLRRQATIISHRLKIDQGSFIVSNMKHTYQEAKTLLGGDPDCVWTVTLSSALLWNRFQNIFSINIPFFLQEHSGPLSMHLKTSCNQKSAKILPNFMPEVAVVADRQLEEFKNISDKFNCRVVWNAVDKVFLKSESNSQMPENQLLYVGRLAHEKGIDRLLKGFAIALESRPGLQLGIVGYGEQEKEMKSLTESLRLQDSVRFLGGVSPLRISKMLEKTNVFVLPSRYENCPVSLLEAQVKGVPCLVTENGASELVLLPGNGLSVKDDGSGRQLAQGILKIFEQLSSFDRLEIQKRALSEFSPEVFAKKMFSLIEEVTR